VIEELAAAQSIVKQEVQDNTEKLMTPITAQTIERILDQEAQAREKVTTTKETFQKFIVTCHEAQQKYQVAWDEPQVSVGGLLGQDFGTSFGNCVACANKGKIIGTLSRINTRKRMNTIGSHYEFGSIDKGKALL
jgi:hypothetical protein